MDLKKPAIEVSKKSPSRGFEKDEYTSIEAVEVLVIFFGLLSAVLYAAYMLNTSSLTLNHFLGKIFFS